jgi:hypothetical protein
LRYHGCAADLIAEKLETEVRDNSKSHNSSFSYATVTTIWVQWTRTQ